MVGMPPDRADLIPYAAAIVLWVDRNTELKYLEGKTGTPFWKYRNTDGSKDKRVSDNFQQASFTSKWQCQKCSAVSKYAHYIDKNPSEAARVFSGRLVTAGVGGRSKTDYNTLQDSQIVNPKSENRKSDN